MSIKRPALTRSLVFETVTWLGILVFLAWSVRLAFLEGYLYELPKNFDGDFTRTAELGSPEWFTGAGLFYGPIFVLEYRYIFAPQILFPVDFARLDYVLFGLAFVCVWLALFGAHRPKLALLALAAWLGHHMSVEAFANTAHLEVVELALISVALLLAVRGASTAAGVSLGLAIATKTLPGMFVPYLAITRQWRMLAGALISAAVLFFVVCWVQGVSPIDGMYSLIYQRGNLTKLEFSEYEYTPRAEIARMLAGDGGTPTPEQARLAIAIHWVLGISTAAFAAWVLSRARTSPPRFGLIFGLVGAVMLVIAPSAHAPYYVFLLPAWTAILAGLVGRPTGRGTLALWSALVIGYVFTGFDQPFFLSQRLFGFGIVVPQHWLAWHLPTVGLALTIAALSALLLAPESEAKPATEIAYPSRAVSESLA
jgi:hypothetical protein